MNLRTPHIATALALLFSLLVGCMEAADGPTASEWSRGIRCPPEWVPNAHGGCGPAVVLCAPDGGAAPNACADVDITRSHPVAGSDGGTTLRRAPDGDIVGAWRWPGEPGGPPSPTWSPDAGAGVPAATWRPDAGIPSCPTGWSRTAEGVCDPLLHACPDGAGALPGGRCTATADADCPGAPFADPGVEAAGASLAYVLAGAPIDCAPRGTQDCPWRSISEALAAGREWVLVGDGTYRERIAVTDARHVVGRCAARVRVEGASDGATVTVRGAGASLDLRGVTVAGGLPGVVVEGGASVRAQRLCVLRATRTGVRLDGPSRFEASDLVIADTQPIGEAFGHGVSASEGSRVHLARAALTRNASTGAFTSGGELAIEDSVVRETRAPSPGGFATGLFARGDARVQVRRSALEANATNGLLAVGIGGAPRVAFVDVVVRGTLGVARPLGGEGAVRLQAGATLDAERVLLDSNLGHGLYVERALHEDGVEGAVSRAWLRDSVVRGPATPPEGSQQVGLFAQVGGELHASRVRVVGATYSGVIAAGEGALLTLDETVVEGTREARLPANAALGSGLRVEAGGLVTARRTLFAGNARYGVLVDAPDAAADPQRPQLTLEDSVVRDNRYNTAFLLGGGVQVQRGGRASLTRTRVATNEGRGISALGGHAALQDCVVEDTSVVRTLTPEGVEATGGQNLAAQDHGEIRAVGLRLRSGRAAVGAFAAGEGAALSLADLLVEGPDGAVSREAACLIAERGGAIIAERAALRRCYAFGALTQNPGSSVTLVDSVVVGTRSVEGVELRAPWGRGLDVRLGATLVATRVLVEDNPEAGVVAAGAGTRASLTGVVVRGIRALPNMLFGHGVFAQEEATLTASRLVVSGSTTGGVASSTGATVTLQDSLVTDVRPSPLGGLGDGLWALSGDLTAERVVVRRTFNSAVTASWADLEGARAGRVTLHDVILHDIRGNAPQIGRGFLAPGLGLQALRGGRIEARRTAIVDVTGFGVSSAPAGEGPAPAPSHVSLTEVFVRNVRPVPLGPAPFDRPYGFGLDAAEGSSIELTRGVIEHGNWGLVLRRGVMRLDDVVVARQGQGLGMSTSPRSATRLTMTAVVARANLLDEIVYGTSEAEVTVPTDTLRCRTLDECRLPRE